jgi:hypothetical protein
VKHDENCPRAGRWFKLPECRDFSTDGTVIGAHIAHSYGTTDEREIEHLQAEERLRGRDRVLTGMEEEQADWEADDDVD